MSYDHEEQGRVCRYCGVFKRLDELVKDKDFKYDRRNECYECRAAACRRYYASNASAVIQRTTRYKQTVAGKEVVTRGTYRMVAKYPEKRRARAMVQRAVREGRMLKPTDCSRCNSGGLIEGHHEDYSKPLEVMWLCHLCHRRLHGTLISRSTV